MVHAILHNYQRYAADFIKTHPASGLFLDMGLGKTLITLTALNELGQTNQLQGNILIIAPKNIAINTWPEEIEKWDHTKNAKYQVMSGLSAKKRDELWSQIKNHELPPKIYIINRELVPKLVEYFGVTEWAFPTVVIDELQSFKGFKSSRFKALRKVRPQIQRIIGLTGTPAPNSLMDLWAQITLLDNGQRLGSSMTQYREAFFHPGRRTPQGYPYEWFLKDGAEDVIYHNINDIIISMNASDYLQMPEITFNMINVELTKKERKVYNTLKKDKVLPLIDGSEITTANAATLAAQLTQLSNGAIYSNPDDKSEVIELHQHKLDALEQIIDSSQGQPILVFFWFKHDLQRILNRIPEAEMFDGTPEHKAKWNRGEVPIMLLQPSSMAHGLNLQDGGHIIVWFSLPWSIELYQQGNARVYRQGQKKPVVIHHIITTNTMDNRILATLGDKEQTQASLIDAVKAELY